MPTRRRINEPVFGPNATSNPNNPTQPVYNNPQQGPMFPAAQQYWNSVSGSSSSRNRSQSPPQTSPNVQINSSGGNFGAPNNVSSMNNVTQPRYNVQQAQQVQAQQVQAQQAQMQKQEEPKPNGFQRFLNDPLGTVAGWADPQNMIDKTKQPGEAGFYASDLISGGTGVTAINSAAINAAAQLRMSQAEQIKDTFGMTRAEQIIRKNQLSKEGARRLMIALDKQGESILNGNLAKESLKAANGISTSTVPTGQAVVNTVTTKAKLEFLKKVFSNSKNIKAMIAFAAGWLFTGSFAYNELNDAISTKGFQANDAIKAKDYEFAEQLREEMEEMDKYNNLWFVLGGPASYIYAATSKGGQSVKGISDTIARNKELDLEKAQLEQKNIDGTMTDEERAHYIDLYPYSIIAQEYSASKKNLDAQGNPIFGNVDPETGEYVPSNIEQAKAAYEEETQNRDALGNPLYGYVNENGVYVPSYTEMAKRLEAQQYYDSLSGGAGVTGGGVAQEEWEPPTSLNFGLLHTAGGYEATKAGVPAGNNNYTVTGNVDNDAVANYLYGVPYDQLPPEAQAVVDKW